MPGTTTIGVGIVLEGKYRVLEELGSGSMGLVYKAIHETLKRKLAIKTLRPEIARDADVVQRFQQEARAAGSLGHPNIVQIFDFGCTPDGAHYIVMEHLEGHSLEDELLANPLPPFERAALLALQVLSGLAAAHRRGIVHRDLKPANIFIARTDDQEVAKILDFGISKIVESADPLAANAGSSGTKAGTILGTPLYMSPEQARGTVIDQTTDIWAMGALLYEMLCGSPPFNFEHPVKVLNAILDGKFATPCSVRPTIPQPLEAIILRAMQMKPTDRFPDATAMGMALRQAMRTIAPAAVDPLAEGTGQMFMKPSPVPVAATAPGTQTVGPGTDHGKLMEVLANVSEDLLEGGDDPDAPIPKARGTVAGAPIARKNAGAKPDANPIIPDRSKERVKAEESPFAPPPEDNGDMVLQLNRSPLLEVAAPRGPLNAKRRPGIVMGDIAAAHRKSLRAKNIIALFILVVMMGAAGAYLYRYHRLGYWGLYPPPPKTGQMHFHVSPSDAEIAVAGDPVTERPLTVPIGASRIYTFTSPGRLGVQKALEVNAAGATHVTVRLPMALSLLEADADYDLDIIDGKGTVVPIASMEDFELAMKKLGMYDGCSRAIATNLTLSRTAFERAAKNLKAVPGIAPVSTEAVGECRSNFAGAAEMKPPMPELEAAAKEYLENLKILGPTSRDLNLYLEGRGYQKDGFAAGERYRGILSREFENNKVLHSKFNSQLLAVRTGLQKMEVDSIRGREGESLHFHIRTVAVASQGLAVALQRPAPPKVVEQKRAALQLAYDNARKYLHENKAALQQVPGAEAFLNSIPAVHKAEPGQGVMWHNQSVDMFNRLVLPLP